MKRWELSILLAGADMSPSEPAVSWGWGSGKGGGDWSTKGQTKLWFGLWQYEGIPLHGSGQVSPAFFPSAFSTASILEWCLHLSLLTKETQLRLYISFLGEISLSESFQRKGTFRLHFYEFCSLLSGYPNICVLTSSNRMHCIVWWYPDSRTERWECSVLLVCK